MTRSLTPRVPAPPSADPARPPIPLTPRVALAAAMMTVVLCALLALMFAPVKLGATAQVASAHYSVQMANYAFSPASITVNEGDTITWTNQDAAPHTVTTTSGPERLDSPYLSKGQSWSYTFTAPGTYQYYCTVHPDMRAQVIVRAPAPATTAALRQERSAPAVQAAGPARAHAAPTTSPSPARSTSAAAAPAPVAPSSASGTAPSSVPVQTQQTADSSGIRTLSPILLLGGLTAAIAVFCLLMVGSRPAQASAPANGTNVAPDAGGGDDDYEY